jgi:large subunit ribosomal protein L9
MASKLLLIEDVEDLGRSGDVVSVKPGYARNLLLPRGLAVVADRNTLRMQARLKEEREKKAAIDRAEAEQSAEQISSVVLSAVVKVDQDGHMYGSVTAHDIADLLQEQASIALEKRFIALKHPIKAIGVHKVNVKLKEGVVASLTLKVISEDDQTAGDVPTAE